MNDDLTVTAEIEVDAPAEVVWSVLVDFSHYATWNPFIRRARGAAKIGSRVHVRVRPSVPFVRLPFSAEVTECVPNRELRWFGCTLLPWLGSGDHVFRVEPLGPTRTRFTQREVFAGALPHLFRSLLERETKRGFDAMNRALARRAVRRMHAGDHGNHGRKRLDADRELAPRG